MRPIEQTLVVGLGAIGTIYATKLKQHNPNTVRVLVDPARLTRYQAEGINLNGVRQDFHFVLPGPQSQKADLILIATKADGLEAAIAAIDGFIHDETIILALLNGITSEDLIAARYGQHHVLHSYFIGHGSTRVGNAITFDGVGRIVFGQAGSATRTSAVDAICRFFDQAHIDYEVPEDILLAQWRKFVVNVGINQASAILRATYGDFQRSEQALAIALHLMDEAILMAEKVGIHQVETIRPWCLDFIRNMPAAFKSSMLQDIEAGKKTEVALFGQAVCELGARYRIPTPYNALFVDLIQALKTLS